MFIPIFGRDNLALTVMVPWDCENNCEFCPSKKLYQEKKGCLEAVKEKMRYVFNRLNAPIRDVVFTGGEPTENVKELAELIRLVPDDKNVYINTTLPEKNTIDFAAMVNKEPKIKGINISRHAVYQEKELFKNVIPDSGIKLLIKKPVRINCVLKDQEIMKVVERWRGRDVELNFRRDYTKEMTKEELHFPYDDVVEKLMYYGYKYHSSSRCHVCDTVKFEKDGMIVAYHKGLQRSSIHTLIALEINDLIIDQTGKLMYDWEDSSDAVMLQVQRCLERRTAEQNMKLMIEKTYTCGGADLSGRCGGYGGTSVCSGGSKRTCGGGC